MQASSGRLGWTALMEAAATGEAGTARLLIQHGADTQRTGKQRAETALHIATTHAHAEALYSYGLYIVMALYSYGTQRHFGVEFRWSLIWRLFAICSGCQTSGQRRRCRHQPSLPCLHRRLCRCDTPLHCLLRGPCGGGQDSGRQWSGC